jgi:hypothetical protein
LTGEKLTSGTVLRVARSRKGIAAFAQRPRIEDFEPTSEDRAKRVEQGDHIIISVFDRARTSISQMFAIRKLGVFSRPVFALSVEGIYTIQVADREPLYVIRDPLPEPECLLPGADGHCGIGDLARRRGELRENVNALLSRLVDAASPV